MNPFPSGVDTGSLPPPKRRKIGPDAVIVPNYAVPPVVDCCYVVRSIGEKWPSNSRALGSWLNRDGRHIRVPEHRYRYGEIIAAGYTRHGHLYRDLVIAGVAWSHYRIEHVDRNAADGNGRKRRGFIEHASVDRRNLACSQGLPIGIAIWRSYAEPSHPKDERVPKSCGLPAIGSQIDAATASRRWGA